MEELFAAMQADDAMAQIAEVFARRQGRNFIYGLAGSQKHAVFAACLAGKLQTAAILVHSREAAEDWREDLASLLPQIPVLFLPELDTLSFAAAAKSRELAAQRMDVLGRMLRGEKLIVIAKAAAAVQKEMSRQEVSRSSLHLELGAHLSREDILTRLAQLGYEHVQQVECRGEFSVRGGIVDVFPVNTVRPLRIELFGDDVDSLREFDVDTQRSLCNISMGQVLPLAGGEGSSPAETFLSYLPPEAAVVFDEPMRIREEIIRLAKENPELKKRFFSWADLSAAADRHNVLYMALMLQKLHGAEPDRIISMVVQAVTPFQRQMDIFAEQAASWLASGTRTILLFGNEEKALSMRELLARKRIPSVYSRELKEMKPQAINISLGMLLNGFELPGAHLAVVTEKDILGRQKKRLRPKLDKGERIAHFHDIKPGDYVVHANHGIGKYLGVETLEVGGVHKDYLHIKYGGDDKLFVPTDQVSFLQKYIGSEGEIPHLHRMGGTEWVKAKAKVQSSVEDIAKQLIALYARRREARGCAFLPDTPWQKEFEEAFPYEETPDQLAATAEIKADMEKEQPMDRLLCGDVGFGKTEVAVRAAFKAVMSGKQVAVLVPTTVLAQQHYQTFMARFLNYGPSVDVICRFRTAAEQRATLAKVKSGRIDILIGTHAILNNKKVQFKELGLLIVDEEQRFGVKQKEKIKTLAEGIDVLTLSATPIPRTLHMSLAGARDMSIIETPPAERFPIQTYVLEYNEAVLRNAIRRELKRGGQVYFVYNRVETIDRMREKLENMLPEARIQTAYGQMSEALLERVMVDFYEGQYDILLATSIVENGLDVANANTIIVYDADHFGLAQLYQMRGRVGRSKQMAFAYFVYQADKVLTETAEKRLQAIKEFAELGAGFKIAMCDLEIRGAGNLLGSQQHGHIASVGFEMYCRLLDEAVQTLKTGKPIEKIPEPVLELTVEAYLDGAYVADALHKIELYQRIASIRTEEGISSILADMIDRFGTPPQSVLNLLAAARLRNYARDLGIKSIVQKPLTVEITFLPKPHFAMQNLLALQGRLGRNIKFLQNPSYMARIKLQPQYRKSVLDFLVRIVRILSGEDTIGQ